MSLAALLGRATAVPPDSPVTPAKDFSVPSGWVAVSPTSGDSLAGYMEDVACMDTSCYTDLGQGVFGTPVLVVPSKDSELVGYMIAGLSGFVPLPLAEEPAKLALLESCYGELPKVASTAALSEDCRSVLRQQGFDLGWMDRQLAG